MDKLELHACLKIVNHSFYKVTLKKIAKRILIICQHT